MSFFRGNETVVIKRRSAAATDDYGNTVHNLTSITVKGCFLGFGSGSEPIDPNRDPVDTQVTIYFPNGTKIEEGDRFIVRNTEWVKDGSPEDWSNPFGLEVGVVVKVRKRNG
jgi:hypothetical protein